MVGSSALLEPRVDDRSRRSRSFFGFLLLLSAGGRSLLGRAAVGLPLLGRFDLLLFLLLLFLLHVLPEKLFVVDLGGRLVSERLFLQDQLIAASQLLREDHVLRELGEPSAGGALFTLAAALGCEENNIRATLETELRLDK